MSEWQDISTAPKDGTKILGLFSNNGECHKASLIKLIKFGGTDGLTVRQLGRGIQPIGSLFQPHPIAYREMNMKDLLSELRSFVTSS